MNEILFKPLGNPLAASRPLEKIADINSRLNRSHYFDGRLLTAEDLERDQVYLDERLREVGRVLGTGIAQGLELSFDSYAGLLTLTAGLGITRFGRMLQLDSELVISLSDFPQISEQNFGNFPYFNRGLYAVVLNYVEVATDEAEVFPTDLEQKRNYDYGSVTEAVQMGLIPLPLPLPQQEEMVVRANLMRTLLDNEVVNIPGDCLPLGVLAVRNGVPEWLDSELLRHPARPGSDASGRLQDLYRQYNSLYSDVLDLRKSKALSLDFTASEYFGLMPAAGSMPRVTVNAEQGVQSYFPEHYKVHVAPVRMAEMDLLIQESLPLPPLDLKSKEVVDIMVLVPLSNNDYGRLAAQLERPGITQERSLEAMDPLRLTLYARPSPHEIDTDADVWREIFDTASGDSVLYVRRPLRAAETLVSGIVLANGFELPEDTPPPPVEAPTSPVDDGGYIIDEDAAYLMRFNLASASEYRMPGSGAEEDAYKELNEKVGNDAPVVEQIMWLMLRISPWFDPVLWRMLGNLTSNSMLDQASSALFENPDGHPYATGKLLHEVLRQSNADGELLSELERLYSAMPAQ